MSSLITPFHAFSAGHSDLLNFKKLNVENAITELSYSSELTEILRVSGMMPNQGFSDFDRLQRGSPSPIGSDIMPNYRGSGLGGWNGRPHDVSTCNYVSQTIAPLVCISSLAFLLIHTSIVY